MRCFSPPDMWLAHLRGFSPTPQFAEKLVGFLTELFGEAKQGAQRMVTSQATTEHIGQKVGIRRELQLLIDNAEVAANVFGRDTILFA